jgi:GntR family transcriptional regulator, transcriptional repressor for pyruvate dehydrogenase complex
MAEPAVSEPFGTLLIPFTLRTAGERIAERIVTAIALGEFVPEQRLPTERELATMLEVSRSTVREALQRLQASGYVTTRRGRGGAPSSAPAAVRTPTA